MMKKTVILVFILYTGFISAIYGADTDTVFTYAMEPFRETNTIQANLKRIQVYKSIVRESSGSFKYDRSRGTVYSYSSPSRFQVFSTSNDIYSFDPAKMKGFHFSKAPQDPLKFSDLDPLERFLSLITGIDSITFLGSVDSTAIYCKKGYVTGKPEITFGIDRGSLKLNLIEFFDTSGQMLQQTFLLYNDNKTELPQVIVTKMVMGDNLLTDSLLLNYKKVNDDLPENAFKLPENINWTEMK